MEPFTEPTPGVFAAIGPDEMPLPSGDNDGLSAYVGILAHLRHATPGKPITFRADDLHALSRALGFDPVHVEARIANCYQARRVDVVCDATDADESRMKAPTPFYP